MARSDRGVLIPTTPEKDEILRFAQNDAGNRSGYEINRYVILHAVKDLTHSINRNVILNAVKDLTPASIAMSS